MSKNIMTLSNAEKLEVASELFTNANKKRSSSLKLLDHDNASAVSLQILSMEEDIKGLILILDFYGFPILKEVKDIHNIFKNHKLRYIAGLILSTLNLFVEDFKKLRELFQDMNRMRKHLNDIDFFINEFKSYSENRIASIKQEIKLFSKMEIIRQRAMYVDFQDNLLSPDHISKKDFQIVSERVDTINQSIKKLKTLFEDQLISQGSVEKLNQTGVTVILSFITAWAKKNKVENLEQIIPHFDEFLEYFKDPSQRHELKIGIEENFRRRKKQRTNQH
ncbi:MAG: AbiV family abortive infection protein [Bacteroidota bacterium]